MTNTRIERVHAREVLDSRGRPTVEVEITCAGSRPGRAMVPSGASTGQFEALELRDRDSSRFDGLGVRRAVEHVRTEIAALLIGRDADDQVSIDRALCELDGTSNKSRLGANAILGASLAVAYAAAEAKSIPVVEHFRALWQRVVATADPAKWQARQRTALLGDRPLLPLPMANMISGGLHAGRNLDFQDFLILPVGATSYPQALEWIVSVYWQLGRELSKAGFEGVLVGDEGGFGPKLTSNEQALDFLIRAIEAAKLVPGSDVALGLDVASTHFFRDGSYQLSATGSQKLQADEVIELLDQWSSRYPIISIEDGLSEDDWLGWQRLTQRLGDRVQLIGDDLFVTNSSRLQRGIESHVGNSVLIKVNQIGSLSETLATLKLALEHDYWPVVSARSGETEDTLIADLVVATGAGQLKVGSVARSERLAKYNQLLRLAENSDYGYVGGAIFRDGSRRGVIR